ncbi:MAG TPA: cytochrome c3 family protein [Candidatus Angelobacter sp.]|nr:cytochrome c3 family protein [Candidatus Angelobacter sp.]
MNGFAKTALLALVVASGTALRADVHPVPLDKNTDSAKCIECHEEKSKGKAVHSAIQMGCTACHEVRVNKDVTRVKLAATTPLSLCLTCHADKNADAIKGTVHKPAVRDCVTCHEPHASDNKFQLKKPPSGDEKSNLCLSCHSTGQNVPEKGSRHTALDMGCDTCHTTHKTGPSPDREFRFHLTKATPALCLDCHDVKDSTLIKAHDNQPFQKTDCLACHNPHQSDRPKLMQNFVHQPFAEKQCATCHQPARDGKVVLAKSSVRDLCISCHAEQAKKIDNAKVQHPGALGDCTDCHNPHAGKSPGLPKPDAVSVCLSCHADQAEQAKKRNLHQPAFVQGCSICHDAHGNDNQKLLRVQNVNTLCLECHGPDAPEPKPVTGRPLIAIFDGTVKLPEDYFKKIPILPLKYGTGHPVDGHPVSNTINIKTKEPVAMTCLSCHQPHASAHGGLLIKDQETNMAFCKNCHTEGTIQLR